MKWNDIHNGTGISNPIRSMIAPAAKRKTGWIFLLLCGVVLLFPGCWNKAAKPGSASDRSQLSVTSPRPKPGQIVFRLAETLTKGYPATIGDIEFARLVEKRSHGHIKIIVYYDGKLGDEKSVIEQVKFGGIDIARVNSAPVSEVYRPMTVLSLPYIFRDSQHLWNVLYGPIGDELLAGLSTKNLIGLTYYTNAARSFYFKRPVHSLDDMKGMRIRVQQSRLYMDLVRALGAEPVPMPFGDIYHALSTGVVDGAENNWSSYYEMKHYQLARYYLIDTHTRSPEVLMMSPRAFNGLSPSDQNLVMKAARDSIYLQWDSSFSKEARSQDDVTANGVTVINLSPYEKERFKQAVTRLYDIYGKEYRGFIERIRHAE